MAAGCMCVQVLRHGVGEARGDRGVEAQGGDVGRGRGDHGVQERERDFVCVGDPRQTAGGQTVHG